MGGVREIVRRFRARWPGTFHITGHVDAADEFPTRIARREVIVAGRSDPTWIAFECPCGRGHRIMVNLDRRRRPAWKITSRQPLSVWPSFDAYTPSGRCHFTLRDGRIRWVKPTDERPR